MLVTQSVVLESAPPRNLLAILTFRTHSRHTEPESAFSQNPQLIPMYTKILEVLIQIMLVLWSEGFSGFSLPACFFVHP